MHVSGIASFTLFFLLVPWAAVAQKVTTDFDETVDFSRFKTYGWKQGQVRKKNPMLDNSLLEKRLKNAVNAQLAAKGLTETAISPDLLVTYVVGAAEKKEIETWPAGRRGWRTRRAVVRYTEGQIVIDLLNASSNELVWRAHCKDTVSDPTKFEKRIDKDIEKAFQQFPPKKKK